MKIPPTKTLSGSEGRGGTWVALECSYFCAGRVGVNIKNQIRQGTGAIVARWQSTPGNRRPGAVIAYRRARRKFRPWQDSNLQSPDSESDALSIRPQGRGNPRRPRRQEILPEGTWLCRVPAPPSRRPLNRNLLSPAPVAGPIQPGSETEHMSNKLRRSYC